MPNKMRIRAPAKLNLHLRVLSSEESARKDGYHSIESVFQAVDLCDELTVEKKAGGPLCRIKTDTALPAENTLTTAYGEFCNLTGIKEGVQVDLIKRIPSGAGLGGGSSDAASLLIVLDKLFETDLSLEQMMQAACRVGSDVAFFLSHGCAVVTGRGEFIREIGSRNDLYFVLVHPDVHSSTKEAYALLDERMNGSIPAEFPGVAELESIYRKPAAQWTFGNSFTEPLAETYPVIAAALKSLKAVGADFAQMTGSGSAVYGVFPSKKEAKSACSRLFGRWKCRVVQACNLPV